MLASIAAPKAGNGARALLCLLVAALAVIAGPARRAAASPRDLSPATRHAVDAIVSSGQGASRTPGVVVGILDPRRGRYVKAYGFGNAATHAPLRVDDHFRIASITKTFTATVILQLVDRHRLRLSDHLDRFVAGVPNGDRITVRQLLNMTAGVFNYTEDATFLSSYFADPLMPFAPADVLAIVHRHPPAFAPGTHVQYSDSNYVLLGLIAEKVTGRPLDRLIHSWILQPLGLRHTDYPTTPRMPLPFARGYLLQPPAPLRDVTASNPGVAMGAGAMVSNLHDLAIWARALAKGTLISRDLQRQRLVTGVLVAGPPVQLSYGLGILDLNGFLGHTGGILGYSTAMFYLPQRNATIVIEANNDDASASVAFSIFLGVASYLYPHRFGTL